MKNKLCILLLLSFSLYVIVPQPTFATTDEKKVAIVIDDFGNNMKGTKEILSLPATLTVAVMPFLSTTKEDAELAHKIGHEVKCCN